MKNLILSLLTMAFLCCGFALCFPGAQAAEEESIALLYDDRKELTTLVDAQGEVSITDEVVTSFKVGSTQKDDHVLVYQDGVVYAVGTGTATLMVGDKSYRVTVSPAPISLFMITGHSGGAGQEGNGSQSVVVEAGQAYSSYHQKSLDVTEVDGYGLGWGSENRVGGEEGLVRPTWDSYGHIDAFAPGMGGATSCASGLAYRWNQLTGEKIWIINIAVGGSCINEWLPGAKGHNKVYDVNYYDQTVSKFTYAQTILKNEVAAGHYLLSKQAIINFAGSNFAWYSDWSNESLEQDYEVLWNAYQKDLFNIDIDGDGETEGLDMLAFAVSASSQVYSGDRPAVWYMASSNAYGHMVAVSDILDNVCDLNWIQNEFPAIDYTTQSKPVSIPDSVFHVNQGGTSENSIFSGADGVHLNQVVNNAQGLEIGENLVKWFFEDGQKTVAESVSLEDRSKNPLPDTVDITVGESFLLVPRVTPVTVNDLTYEITGAAELEYPLAVKGTSVGTATLTVKQGDRVLKTMTFRVGEVHMHCECGENLTGAAEENHTCGEDLVYVPLTRYCFTDHRYHNSKGENTYVSTALRSGNYYLKEDYTLSGTIYVAPGETVNICLNGHKLTSPGRTFAPNGNLNICDCSEHGTGSVYSKRTGTSPVLYSNSGSVVNIYGGTFSSIAPKGREFGGCMSCGNDLALQDCDLDDDGVVDNATKGKSTLNIWGGKLIGSDLDCSNGSPLGSGGGACVYVVNSSCTLNIWGGELSGGKPVPAEDGGKIGGGVIGITGGTCYIYGGTFRNSRDNQGAIWTNTSSLHISGSPVFENNQDADVFLHYCDHVYFDGLNVKTPVRVAGSTHNYTKVHLTNAEEASMLVGAHGLTMTEPNANLIMYYKRDNTYCECGGTLSDEIKMLSGHVCTDATWVGLCQNNQTSRFTTTSTTDGQSSTARFYLKSKEVWIYLTGNVNLTNEIEISDGYTLHIDLNGYTLTHSAGSASLFRVHGKLTICDSYGGGRAVGVRTGTSEAEASCVYVQNYNSYAKVLCKPQFHFYSGTLTGFNMTSATDRTPVAANQAGVVQIGNNSGNKDALFNMYGGTICDGMAKVGGNILLAHGTMNLYDGLILGGTATTSYGGNLRVSSGNTFTMYGGTLKNGTAMANAGGNVFISSGNNRILGGTFENGLASGSGGNLYLGGGTLEVSAVKLLGGCANQGGNMYVYGGTANIINTQMTDGLAGYSFTRNADGTLSHTTDGGTSGNAGNLYVGSATANLTGCILSGGSSIGKNGSNGFGGNVYNKGVLNMDGCTVSGGSCFRGGAVGVRDSGTLGACSTVLKNCIFFNNRASVSGNTVGGWFDTNGCEIVLENCSIDDSSVLSGSVIAADNSRANKNPVTVRVKDCTIKGTQEETGYVIWANYGTVVLEGTVDVDAAATAVYLTGTAQILADDFAPSQPMSVDATFGGKIGTSAIDKSECFVNAAKGITWKDGELRINGLLQGEKGTYKTFADALQAGENSLKLLSDYKGNADLAGDLYLDLNGKILTGDITGTGTLQGMDSGTDDYTTGNMGRISGSVSCVVADHCKEEATQKRYLAIADSEGYTFHRFYLGITKLTLRTGDTGFGYKAKFKGDDAVRSQIDSFGFRLNLAGNETVITKALDGEDLIMGKEYSLLLKDFNIADFGEREVNAEVFLNLKDGTQVESTRVSYSMKTMLQKVCGNLTRFTDSQISALRTMCDPFKAVMQNWNIDELLK